MPKAARRISGPSARQEPYSKTPPSGKPTAPEKAAGNPLNNSEADKENTAPNSKPSSKSSSKPSSKSSSQDQKPANFLDIKLPGEEEGEEVPIYDSAGQVRRRMTNLFNKKTPIPGDPKGKPITPAAFQRFMQEAKRRDGGLVNHPSNIMGGGPSDSATRTFRAKKGDMAGADSEVYYYAYVVLEKLRIWRGEKESKGRKEAMEKWKGGRARKDPWNTRILARSAQEASELIPSEGWARDEL